MTYNTPELVLVGAAQSFVLGGIDVKFPGVNIDSPSLDNYDVTIPFEMSGW